jgi:hypothetical protein
MKFKRESLCDSEKIMLSRIYKLDRQIGAYMLHHKNMSMNKLLPTTDFIKKANLLYRQMSKKLIEISLKQTKYTHNLVDMKKILSTK